MLKNLSRLEHKIGDRIYHFFCDVDAPIFEVKDVLLHFLKYSIDVEEAHIVAAQSKEELSKALPSESLTEENTEDATI